VSERRKSNLDYALEVIRQEIETCNSQIKTIHAEFVEARGNPARAVEKKELWRDKVAYRNGLQRALGVMLTDWQQVMNQVHEYAELLRRQDEE
jgi:hypothetical protein